MYNFIAIMCELHHVLLVWIRLKSWLIQGKSLLKSSRPLALLRHAPSAACGQNCNKIGGYGFKSLLRKSKLLNHSNHYTFNNAEYPIGSTCSTIAITEEYKCGKPNAINPKKMRFSYIYIYIGLSWFIGFTTSEFPPFGRFHHEEVAVGSGPAV